MFVFLYVCVCLSCVQACVSVCMYVRCVCKHVYVCVCVKVMLSCMYESGKKVSEHSCLLLAKTPSVKTLVVDINHGKKINWSTY